MCELVGGDRAVRAEPAAPPARRRPRGRLFTVATMTGLLVVLSLTGNAAAWAAAAGFVPASSSAVWDGDTVAVTFQEAGVGPGVTTTILIQATGTVDAVCEKDGEVLVSTHSSATNTDVSNYVAGADGTVTGSRELAVTVQPPTITGLGCTTRVVRTFTVLLHDLDTGARLVLSGSATGGPSGDVIASPQR
jgi:hypothetical protein